MACVSCHRNPLPEDAGQFMLPRGGVHRGRFILGEWGFAFRRATV